MRIAKRITIFLFLCSVLLWIFGKEQVKKKDIVPPIISFDSEEIHVEAKSGEQELKQGLQAWDDVDGDLTNEIIVGTISPFSEKGVCKVEYIVFDSSNNVGRCERIVHFDNYESPILKLSKPLVYEVNGQIIISDRLMVEDVLEGDISKKMRFSSLSLTAYEVGTYKLNVEVKNSYGDIVKHQLPINVVPYNCDKEYIQLKEYLVYVNAGESIQGEDYIEEIIGRNGEEFSLEQISITSEVDFSIPGAGQICYELCENEDIIYATYLTVIVTE